MRETGDVLEIVQRAPHPALRRHVAGGYWGYREVGPPIRRVEVAQTGIVVHLALGPPLAVDGAVRGSFVAGLYDAPVVLDHAGEQLGMQVDFTPVGARLLFGRPLGDLTRDVVPADDVLGRSIAELEERLAGLPGWPERFDVLDAYLLRRLRDAEPPRADVAYAWARLAATDGAVAVADLCRELGCSRRHLASRFREELGLGPKAVGRILRFERAVEAVRAGRPLAAIAAQCGYADQAHLTREFRALAGVTPAAYRDAVTNDQDGQAIPA